MSQDQQTQQDQSRNATWRGTTNCSSSGLSISFDAATGEVIRVHLSLRDACLLAQSLDEYLLGYLGATHSHSVSASGIPIPAVLPHEGVKV